MTPAASHGERAGYHHGNLRSALLALAAERIERVGVDGLSLRELARELGVSHGAPRPHFRDRQALLDALAVEGLNRLAAELDGRSELHDSDRDFGERLLAFARTYVQFAVGHPVLLSLMFARKDHAEEVTAANDRTFAATQGMIQDALRTGEISGEQRAVEMAVLANLQGLAVIISGEMLGDRDAAVVVENVIDVLLAGLRAQRGGAD